MSASPTVERHWPWIVASIVLQQPEQHFEAIRQGAHQSKMPQNDHAYANFRRSVRSGCQSKRGVYFGGQKCSRIFKKGDYFFKWRKKGFPMPDRLPLVKSPVM